MINYINLEEIYKLVSVPSLDIFVQMQVSICMFASMPTCIYLLPLSFTYSSMCGTCAPNTSID